MVSLLCRMRLGVRLGAAFALVLVLLAAVLTVGQVTASAQSGPRQACGRTKVCAANTTGVAIPPSPSGSTPA